MTGQPDPKCRWCKGTGQVVLFTSLHKCDCVSIKEISTRSDPADKYDHCSPYIDSTWAKRTCPNCGRVNENCVCE